MTENILKNLYGHSIYRSDFIPSLLPGLLDAKKHGLDEIMCSVNLRK